jgi:type VII secretion-associated serine protease mycosin
MTFRKVAAAAAALAVVLLPTPAQARAYAACDNAVAPHKVSTATPYEDQLYDLARIAPVADGRGVRVAVVDSGVDATHPQLKGHVATGHDFLKGNPDGRQDCIGHGTGVASIIAAVPVGNVPFHGLAPGATIVPIRISEQEEINGETVGEHGTSTDFANAIDFAADPDRGDAQVINLSLVMTQDDSQVREAVARAIARGVVVVAAVGNNGDATKGNPTPYPASYPDVIGVGAIGPDGLRAAYSEHGPYVDVMAAGDKVTVAALHAGQTTGDGTSFAAPFVSATAALLKQRFPALTPAQITHRIVATADPAPGGRHSDEYGYGLLNPYRALTETLGPDVPASPAPVVMHTADPAALALQARRAHSQDMALLVAAIGAGVVALVGILAAVVRRGRRRGWRAAS